MAEVYEINVSELRGFCPKLRAGDKVLLSGYVYTARDAAHKRFDAMLDKGEKLPVDLENAVIRGSHACSGGKADRFMRSYDLGKNG